MPTKTSLRGVEGQNLPTYLRTCERRPASLKTVWNWKQILATTAPPQEEGGGRVPTQAPQRRTPSIKYPGESTHASLYIIVGDAELLRPCTCSYHPRRRAPRKVHSKVLTSGQRRSPRRRSQHLTALALGLACLEATFCALVRPSDEKSESALSAAHVFSVGTAALARHGIAVWVQVPGAGVITNDVASLPAPSRAAGSATARNAARC